jgi:hypothetical protein
MCPPSDHEKSIRVLSTTVQIATSTPRPSPKNTFDNKFDLEKSAIRVGKLREQQQKIHELNQHCDKAVAEIRASLERSQGKGG